MAVVKQPSLANSGLLGNVGQMVSLPAAMSSVTLNTGPSVKRGKNSIVIRHKELVGGILGSVLFNVSQYALNPGSPVLFPWLSTQSWGWERYIFRKLVFYYITRCGSGNNGTVMLSPDYDAADLPPVNEPSAGSYVDSVEGPVTFNFCCPLNREAMLGGATSKYIRTFQGPPLTANSLDVKTYDSGNLFVCTVDCAANFPIGKLWVEYEVELITPHTLPPSSASTVAVAGAPSFNTPFTPTVAGVVAQYAGPFIALVGGNTVTFGNLIPGAYYLMQCFLDIQTVTTAISSTTFETLYNLVETSQVILSRTRTTNGKELMLESIMQAVAPQASLGAYFGGSGVLNGSAFNVIPISSPTDWTFGSW